MGLLPPLAGRPLSSNGRPVTISPVDATLPRNGVRTLTRESSIATVAAGNNANDLRVSHTNQQVSATSSDSITALPTDSRSPPTTPAPLSSTPTRSAPLIVTEPP